MGNVHIIESDGIFKKFVLNYDKYHTKYVNYLNICTSECIKKQNMGIGPLLLFHQNGK